MAERGSEKMTEWLDIHVDTLSSEERILLIEEIAETLSPQELLTLRDQIERRRQRKLEEAKSAVLEEMKGRLSELGLTLNDVVPARRPRIGQLDFFTGLPGYYMTDFSELCVWRVFMRLSRLYPVKVL